MCKVNCHRSTSSLWFFSSLAYYCSRSVHLSITCLTCSVICIDFSLSFMSFFLSLFARSCESCVVTHSKNQRQIVKWLIMQRKKHFRYIFLLFRLIGSLFYYQKPSSCSQNFIFYESKISHVPPHVNFYLVSSSSSSDDRYELHWSIT